MSRDVNERRPSASVRVNPSDGSCGRVADTDKTAAPLLDELAALDPAEGVR